MVRQHHQLSGHESEQTPGDSEGQGSLVCCSLQGQRGVGEDSATEQWQDSIKSGISWIFYRKQPIKVIYFFLTP